ncbi:hypothetical protein GCM10020331_001020 [Ectobacillus funiculus]
MVCHEKNPVEVSKAQIEAFQSYYNSNNRDIQPLNERPILKTRRINKN